MNLIRRPRLVYGVLLAVWGLVLAWQVAEHGRVKNSARSALINRSRDITTTLGLVVRSQRRWGVVSQERLESALHELVQSGELSSVALLNSSGETVASAGAPIKLGLQSMIQAGIHWEPRSVTVVNLVDLGANEAEEGSAPRPTIVLPRRDPTNEMFDPQRRGPRGERRTNQTTEARQDSRPPPPPPPERREGEPGGDRDRDRGGDRGRDRGGDRERSRRRSFGRPFWMDEAEYKSMIQKRGLHGLIIAMSTDNFQTTCLQDTWMRCLIGCLAGVSVLGLGMAWRNLGKSSELQMRLLRASELNTHLKEMNLAAAGLAHETRNPLNIVRGLAQIISRQKDASPEIRTKSVEILEETDRVTAQLNEFINYSRPREVRRAPVALSVVVAEVERALSHDISEKNIQLQIAEANLTVEADEQLLRQVLFNLLLNAIQAVQAEGEIRIIAEKNSASSASLEILDNGPGVPPDQRAEIFKPYVTHHEKGTGLGLAVVQQIVLAHGWEIECLSNQPRGAVFRITHMKLL